jgi:hypothetical protein
MNAWTVRIAVIAGPYADGGGGTGGGLQKSGRDGARGAAGQALGRDVIGRELDLHRLELRYAATRVADPGAA